MPGAPVDRPPISLGCLTISLPSLWLLEFLQRAGVWKTPKVTAFLMFLRPPLLYIQLLRTLLRKMLLGGIGCSMQGPGSRQDWN